MDEEMVRFCDCHGINAQDVLNLFPDFKIDDEGKEPVAYFDACNSHNIIPANSQLADWLKHTISFFKR